MKEKGKEKEKEEEKEMKRETHESTSKTQYPKVPNETTELWESVPFVNLTFMIPMSLMTGAEMVVMRRRMEDAKRRNVPMW